MFISRKRLDLEIEKAKKELRERYFMDQQIRDIQEKIVDLDKRVTNLECEPEEDSLSED